MTDCSEDELPLWRQAIQDAAHPLYSAAWHLFSVDMSLKLVDRLPPELRPQIIDFCYLLIDTDELYLTGSPGSGFAPYNAIRLLGHWQVTEAIPRLVKLLKEDTSDMAYEGSIDALSDMGHAVIEPLLEFVATLTGKEEDLILKPDIASTLAKAGKGDDRAFQAIKMIFESLPVNDDALDMVAESLLRCQPEAAISYLEDCLRQGKYRRWKKEFLSLITRARKGQL